MCLLSFGWRQFPDSRLTLVANRDEFHARPTAAAHWWQGEIQPVAKVLGGRDLQAGGGWLGVNRGGHFAALTNFREVPVTGKRSRGELVSQFLASGQSAAESATELYKQRDHYAGFNLLLADASDLYYVSNRSKRPPQRLAPGMYGLSNALLNSPWPKSLKTTKLLEQRANKSMENQFSIFADREQANDADLPVTAMPAEWEKLLSSPFIRTDDYGTRATTAVTIADSGAVRFSERRFNSQGEATGTSHFRFQVAVS